MCVKTRVLNRETGARQARGERELEGIVAKRRSGRYRPGERGWVKIKSDYWRYELERESAINRKRVRQFV